ncbi:MAG: VanW family protein [Candidatus Shapirobacteria bacterium]|nr:VanW family protein [Candidatus Shapirobacteria bacterium]
MKHFTNLILALLITLTPVLLLFIPIIINYDKTGSNTYLLDKDYSHLSRSQILQHLDQDFILPSDINLLLADKNYSLSLASISASIDQTKIANSMLYRRLNEGIFQYIKYFFHRKNFSLIINFDSNLLDQQISILSDQINKPFIPTEAQLKSGKIVITTGSLGLELDTESLKTDINSTLTLADFTSNINLKTKVIGNIPTSDVIDSIKSKAQKIIGKNLSLSLDSDTIIIDDSTLISWLGFDTDFQDEKISDYVKNLAQSLQHDPVNAVFKFENNKVLEFQPSKNGISVKEDELISLIKQSADKLFNSQDKSIIINIPVNSVEPIIKNDDVNDLGIKELLGRGTSTFKHSAATRNENITKGSSIVNRILVAPDDTFSFIKSLGEVSLEAGYKKAYIIREGKTELDVGGGICQVSTTLFRAMLNSGLNIIERQAHAYRVSYYEEDSKPGFDATVFIPSPDLKFINDTGHYVLIQSVLDMTNRRLTYEIYGTNDGRKSEISNYRQWGAQPAPPDVWIDDSTLEVGKVVQDEHAIPGLKTAFDWTVTNKDGQVIHQKTFNSNFVPWAAVYRRGTKI